MPISGVGVLQNSTDSRRRLGSCGHGRGRSWRVMGVKTPGHHETE